MKRRVKPPESIRVNGENISGDSAAGFVSGKRHVWQVVLIAKLILIALIAWITVSTLVAFLKSGEYSQSTFSSGDSDLTSVLPAAPVSPLLLSAFDDGAWEFADMPWQIRMATVKPKEIERELAAMPPNELLDEGANSEEAQRLIALLRKTGAVETRIGQITRLQSNSSNGTFAVFTRSHAQGESLVMGRLAWPEENHWRLIEGRPAASKPQFNATQPELPPMPAGSSLLGTRWGSDGVLLGQIRTFENGRDETLDLWKQAGWNVRRLSTDFAAPENNPLLLVERGELIFAAQFFASPVGPTTLFLTRVPDDQAPARE